MAVQVVTRGEAFEIPIEVLDRYPDSKLTKLVKKEKSEKHYFDRDPQRFRVIANFYRDGKFHVPPTLTQAEIEEEAAFWEVGNFTDKLTLNVGGEQFTMLRSTLQNFPKSMLARMFDPANRSIAKPAVNGEYFFDRDPSLFRAISKWYRNCELVCPPGVAPEELVSEAAFWGMPVPPAHEIVTWFGK